ncbi:MAG: substrate-binding domain-containing protein [Verrucomicrobiota bacterium]
MKNTDTASAYPASDELRQRVYHFARILNQSRLFGDKALPEPKFYQLLHMPRALVHEALMRLVQEEQMALTEEGFETRAPSLAQQERVLFFLNQDFFTTPYAIHIDYLIGAANHWEQQGWKTQVIHMHEAHPDIEKHFASMVKTGVKGIVAAGTIPETLRKSLKKLKIPILLLGNATIYQNDFGVICSENFNGMVELVRDVLRKGHQKIAYFTSGILSHHGQQDRLAAYEQVMLDAGLPFTREFAYKEPYRPLFATHVAEVLSKKIDRPTAIVCGNDREAFELIVAFQKHGIKVPAQIGVTGFYNSILNLITEPALTSVDIRGQTMGQLAAHYLLQDIHSTPSPIRILVPTHLEKRRSVLPLLGSRPIVDDNARKTSVIRMDDDDDLIQF